MTTVDEKTKIPLGIAVTICGVVGAGAFWMAMLTSSVSNATNKNVEQDELIKAQLEINKTISTDLTKIKARFKID